MPVRTPLLVLVAALGALAAPVPAIARPEGAAARAPKGGVFPEVAEATAEEAKSLVEALRQALAGKEEGPVVAALQPLLAKKHADFVPELRKLLADKRMPVAAAAAAALGSQGDKSAAPLLAKAVAADGREKGILRDADLKAAAIEALGRLGVSSVYEKVRELVESVNRDPDVRYSYAKRITRAAVRYFGLTKEKRSVSFLIEYVEEPRLEGGITGSTPPAEYWKGKSEIWQEVRWEVPWALKEITGLEFETRRRWKAWFDADGKKAGVK